MLKLDYLKKVITESKLIEDLNWHISCFAIPLVDNTDKWKENTTRYMLVNRQDGMYFIDIDESNNYILTKISDYKKDEPLFNYKDVIQVDSSWLPSISSKIETKVGILLVNAIVLYPSVGIKIPFINEHITVRKIEQILANKVIDNGKATDKDISVNEMIDCIDRLNFLSNLSTIINIASTPKVIAPPPNIDKIKKQLLEEYKDKLDDPVKVVELEDKLVTIDNEYLGDDIAVKNVFSKKSKKARKKVFLMYGTGLDFETTSSGQKPILNSLSEGIDTSEESLPKYINDSRYASFSRGKGTQLGGYAYKILQRSLTNIEISNNECNTTRGLFRLITNDNYSNLISRYIKLDNKWILIETVDKAKEYIGKIIEIRSSMYCTSPGNTICYKCLSELYKDNRTAVTNIASELSSVLLTQSLKLMHNAIKEAGTLNLEDIVT